MAKRYHLDSVQEFQFCKTKILKLLNKRGDQTLVKNQRLKKQTQKFINKMKEIEAYHQKMGWPHPDADFSSESNVSKKFELMMSAPGKAIIQNPDGSLFQKNSLVDLNSGTTFLGKSGLVNLDGTTFETPVMPGAVLSPQFHSEQKLQEYLNQMVDAE